MAALTVNLYSEVLGREEKMTVVYPTTVRPGAYAEFVLEPGIRYQTLWLLHGENQGYSDWLRFSQIEDYSDEAKMIVIMPEIHDLSPEDPETEDKNIRYLAEELPDRLGGILPLSMERKDHFIAGISDGGLLAYRVCLRYPEKYGVLAAFSANVPETLCRALSDRQAADFPEIYQCAGTGDGSLEAGLSLIEILRKKGYRYTWSEGPGGYDFRYWDVQVKQFINWNPSALRAPIHPVR